MDRLGRTARSFCWAFLSLMLLPVTSTAFPQEDGGNIVISGKEILRMKANKIADILNQVPGVSAGDSSVGIHGSYKVKVFVDGRPINDPTSSTGGVNWSLVNLEEIEKIEILRGKGGVRYGQDASGGVILITTNKIGSITGMVKGYGGSQDSGFIGGNIQGQAGSLGAAFSGEAETTQGYKENNDNRRYKGGAKLTYSVDSDRSFSASGDYVENERGLSGLPEYPTPYSRKKSQTAVFSAQGKYFKITNSTYFNTGEQHNTDSSKGLNQKLQVTELGEDLNSSLQTGNFGELAYGAGYRWSQASGSTFDDQSEEVFSLFASQALKYQGCPWMLSGGLRASANSAFADVVNPELKLIYQQKHWNLTGSYSGSNNIPSFFQRYNYSSSTRPNPNLDMETADNFSLALFVQTQPMWSGRLSLFYNLLSDRITYLTGDDGIGEYQNFGEVRYQGGDLALTWKAATALTLKTSYTYLEATDEETGLRLPAKALHTATFDSYWQATERLMVILSGKYVSEVYRNKANTKTVPDYIIGNLRAEYSLNSYALFAEIKNFTDTTYYYADGLLAPPLAWMAGLSWKF